jgi:aminocarboxymuconate-semialdehyde decarboxylase
VELERAVTELGAVGMSMGGANFGGLEVHDKAFDPLWAKVVELGVPIFVHGYNQSVTWGDKANDDPFDTTSIIGMCYDETRCFWYLVNGGVLDRFPDLRVYITHAGGFVPYQLMRMEETNLTMAPDSKNERPVSQYRDNFYFDPLAHSVAMRRAIVEDVGVDRLLYGDNFGGMDSIDGDLTEGLGLSDEDREKIRSGNAKQLLGV